MMQAMASPILHVIPQRMFLCRFMQLIIMRPCNAVTSADICLNKNTNQSV